MPALINDLFDGLVGAVFEPSHELGERVLRPPSAPPCSGAHVRPQPIFSHPQAQRSIELGGQVVGYALQRGRRRSIGFVIDAQGLRVRAPPWIGVREIEAALLTRGEWIVRKLHEQHARSCDRLAARVQWSDGATFPVLGEPLRIVLTHTKDSAVGDSLPSALARRRRGAHLPKAELVAAQGLGSAGQVLRIDLGASGTTTQPLGELVQTWLRQQALSLFDERCRWFAPRLEVQPTRVALSAARTRWGSATTSGVIRLNWRLVHLALPTIDYVVAHELAHLREMNHGPRFWSLVRGVMPDYEAQRNALRRASLPLLE